MSDDNELIESLKAWAEHFTPKNHPVALTLNRARVELTAAKQQLDEVTKQRDALHEWKDSAIAVESSWDAQAVGQLLGVPLGCAILPQIEPAIRKMIEQRDGLVTACRALLMSPEVQGSWPLDGSKRAQKPSDTYSKAEAKVKFRHLLKIHSIIEKGGES